MYFGSNGNLILNKKTGYAKATVQYNNQGKPIEMAFFDAMEQLARVKSNVANFAMETLEYGFAKATFKYDEQGNLVESSVFQPPGMIAEDGCSSLQFNRDAHGNMTASACFDAEGKLSQHKNGYAKATAKYDKRNNLIERVYFGVDGAPIVSKFGYARFMATYDEQGVMRSFVYTDINDQPVKPTGRVVVNKVLENSQAQRLGVQVGDVITTYNQIPINAAAELITATGVPGDGPRTLVVGRAGQTLTFPVQPGKIGVGLDEVAATTSTPTEGKPTTP
jgi:hypothetical protein